MQMMIDIDQLNTEALAAPANRPVIGITGNFDEGQLKLLPGYFRSIEAAGGTPVVIPPRRKPDASLISLIDRIDGLLLSGGADINPILLGEDPVPALHGINNERDAFELALTRLAYNRQVPMLGICRGIQVLAAALGGTVMQDIATAMPHSTLVKHSQDADRGVATHFVTAEADSVVGRLLGTRFAVNSFHHQAVGEPGPHFRVTARSADGVVEAIESTDMKSIIGVQWHPECFWPEGDSCMMPLFEHFVANATQFATAKRVHEHVLTLDSHCDTPMFFDKGVELTRRDPQLLVDFPKMREGHLDATTMVAYLPQGGRSEQEELQATQMAVKLLNEIETRVADAPNVALARTPADLYRHKLEGKLSVMRGIENGYALGRDIDNVARFAQMGVVYITLCHNGDNDICDSARGTQTWGGVSPFGREVIARMNKLGIMVDLSHAAESSFYDALELSTKPIVCSHSSCRALCDHPRNLTDDQMRCLAQKGGVMQVTAYHGFLSETSEATIQDFMEHLRHAVEVMGIDHVGLGTDFDGDGGIPGLADSSDMLNFTRELLINEFSEEDIKKIWGGNWLRVMREVQDVR